MVVSPGRLQRPLFGFLACWSCERSGSAFLLNILYFFASDRGVLSSLVIYKCPVDICLLLSSCLAAGQTPANPIYDLNQSLSVWPIRPHISPTHFSGQRPHRYGVLKGGKSKTLHLYYIICRFSFCPAAQASFCRECIACHYLTRLNGLQVHLLSKLGHFWDFWNVLLFVNGIKDHSEPGCCLT